MNFIYDLYQKDNFVLILVIILIVLVTLFVLIYFLGKKDEKLEETRKLQKLELDAFKTDEENSVALEVEEKQNTLEEVKEEEKNVSEVSEEPVNITLFEPSPAEEEVELPIENVVKPLFSDKDSDEAKPISLDELDLTDDTLENDLNTLENIKTEFEDIKIPEEKEEIKPIFKPSPQIFSSVFVNKEVENDNNIEESKIVVEQKEETNKTIEPSLFAIINDEEDMELPSLSKQNTKNYNELETESYKIDN